GRRHPSNAPIQHRGVFVIFTSNLFRNYVNCFVKLLVYSFLFLIVAFDACANLGSSVLDFIGEYSYIITLEKSTDSGIDSIRILNNNNFFPNICNNYPTANDIRSSLFKEVSIDFTDAKNRSNIIKNRNVLHVFSFKPNQRIYSWKYDEEYMSTVECNTDTSLWLNHLFYPQQKILETYTFLGNLGSPVKYDHFFSNQLFEPFLFNNYNSLYAIKGLSQTHYNIKKPFTVLEYSTAGKRKVAEQVLKAIHTQNVNQYLNFGVIYNFYGTKGIYSHQETKNNSYSVFSSYVKGNFSLQGTFSNNIFKNEENGGIVADSLLLDEDIEPQVLPFNLSDVSGTRSEYRERHISTLASYTLVNIENKELEYEGIKKSYSPLLTMKMIVNGIRYTRTFIDLKPDTLFYDNLFINPSKTYDSVYCSTWDAGIVLELEQLKSYPGLPGFRVWVNSQHLSAYSYKPGDFVYSKEKTILTTNHIGIAAYSSSNYFSYKGAARFFIDGYKSDDKDLRAEVSISPWRKEGLPILSAKIYFQDITPDIFLQNYFSNHYYWNNSFKKEKWFWINGSLKSDLWRTEIGYNLMHVKNYIYFDTTALPNQAANLDVVSLYAQNTLKFWRLNFVNRIVWQSSSNREAVSLPKIIFFTSLFYEGELVKNALRAQIGLSAYYRTLFYADAYNVATGQFYNQREKELGNYPMVDLYANLKWKRAILYFKYEHVNQRYPHSEYFSALHYPINPRIFKFGVSWIFYD
ncbi:MAG TPA: hypothetical protein PL017_09950, partial [Tenuifilaceae bacterium]|nr:hypothetical protein [Tenuifilaceae bacterium]HPE18955.1 hypothetical protein [Tenuifilaceae bacterium]HPJ46410.1 hypothetical protein [Tenuifilaceae bacterium]HPQ34599.1 hypothetical protein [Tenuifilaceae bacterium]HRX67431.1 hypothetical protein [Tenuifilaceae bacterium]